MSITINVTACDNQLVIYAVPAGNSRTYQLCSIESGYNYTVNVALTVDQGDYSGGIDFDGLSGNIGTSTTPDQKTVQLPSGAYRLYVFAADWGGQQHFDVHYTDNSTSPPKTTPVLTIPKAGHETVLQTWSTPPASSSPQFNFPFTIGN